MSSMAKPFQRFEDLDAYKSAREFRIVMYEVTRRLQNAEMFKMASQIRRAALSFTNNIAEGHGRFRFPDQMKFMLQARGSLQKLLDDLNACQDEKYFSHAEIAERKELGWKTLRLLNGYIRRLRDKGLVRMLSFAKHLLPMATQTAILRTGHCPFPSNHATAQPEVQCNNVAIQPRNRCNLSSCS